MKNSSALLTAATADKVMAWAIAGGVLLVIILLARAVGRLAKHVHAPAAPVSAPKSAGGRGKLLLAVAAALGGWWLVWGRHENAAPAKATPAPSPSPAPRPTITQTVAPHVTSPAHPALSGSTIVWIFVIAAVVAIVLLGPLLRRSS